MKSHAKIFLHRFPFVLTLLLLVSCAAPAVQPPETAASAPTLAPTRTSTPTGTPTSTPTPVPTPLGGGSGKVIFGYLREGYQKQFPELEGESNIFVADLDGSHLLPITNGLMVHHTLADVSPDGRQALVIAWPDKYTARNSTSGIYVIDLENTDREPFKVASGVMYYPNRTALWLDNTRLAFVDMAQGSWTVFVSNSDGSERRKLSRYIAGIDPWDLRVSADGAWVFWHAFGFAGGSYKDGGIWRASVDGTELSLLDNSGYLTADGISPDGSQAVWRVMDPNNAAETISIAPFSDLAHPKVFTLERSGFTWDTQIFWSPDGKRVLLNRPRCTPLQLERTWDGVTMMLSVPERKLATLELPSAYDDSSVHLLDWSPDGRSLLVRIASFGNCYSSIPGAGVTRIMDPDSLTFTDILTENVSQEYVANMLWIP